MLKSKTEKDGTINANYDSSDIHKSVYDKKEKKLVIIYKKGNMYMFDPVSEELYNEFEKASSQGKFFADRLKNNKKINFVKLTKLKDFELKNL